MTTGEACDTVTYGVAIAVPEPHASHLRGKRCEFGDPEGEIVPTHVTLVPPTAATAAQLATVRAALAAVGPGHRPFTMRLDGTDTFAPVSPVAFVAVADGSHETARLADDVRGRLESGEPDFPFHPHVTVAHHLDRPSLDHACQELAGFTAEFQVRDFVLFCHDGAGWHVDTRFPLG
ncbi:MAG: 2'-5' RNA ligase family protein [Aeromicrobium sp.]|uniref:2'-5' RNA ligase family protein n=1 Tax=Aeromicrobium sp. TaxID=1871063 RepID=UPI0025BEA827|nr:2'-5' RNA ligase family protein [Aeromicrobium sp.]MCK5892308.1 2'-5' RNA ligase family protein [Aeromicrobium sp.]MDF1704648.1 2'-5' RNA ligase family protein [Aeromicrobium sp.]